MKKVYLILLSALLSLAARSQEERVPDSIAVDTLSEVIVSGFELGRSSFKSSFVVAQLRMNNADRYNKTSLVNGFNTIAGVRMEERSPGSYRINVRGSSLRSPFGVRNIKIYWNGIPITDPGGNTYFNQFALNNFSSIEIFKGPAGSLYGAGTGGLVLMQSFENSWKPGVSIEYAGGSFGLHNVFVTAKTGGNNNRSLLTYAHNEHDGYRIQSAVRRDNMSWSSLYRLSPRQELMASVLFTNMYYQTPGGLTKTEFDNNPKAARPAAGGFPGAVQAKAAIYQKNLLAGIQHRYKIDTHWSNTTALYVAYAQIKNPTVRNYERRSEPHAGGRTSFSWEKETAQSVIKIVAGGELQEGFFNTKVFQNRQGVSDTLQTDDDIRFHTYNVFAQADLSIADNWFITAGTSVNNSKVEFTRLNQYPLRVQSRTYRTEWAPRISILKNFHENTSVFAIVSKGFSPPTLAELLPSTSNI
ncbi:MAG: TonB-dependent receptor, partial [Chitinophagaceae bacterium]